MEWVQFRRIVFGCKLKCEWGTEYNELEEAYIFIAYFAREDVSWKTR